MEKCQVRKQGFERVKAGTVSRVRGVHRFVCAGLVVVAVMTVGGSLASATEIKIGYVDMQKALQTVAEGKKAKAQLEKEFNAKKKELQGEESAIKKLGEDFKKQSLVLNDDARAKKQGEIQERILRFQELTQRSQMEIQQKEQELTQPLVVRLRALVQSLAKKKNYALVLEKNENTVLYSLEQDDLTAEVVSEFDKGGK
jgi:outer membrane protein